MDMSKLLVKLDSETCLQNAASQFLVDSGIVEEYQKRGAPVPRFPRVQFWNSRQRRRFEDWLFERGAVLVQDNGRFHLAFFNEPDRTFFMLKWQR
jgi:hypothetical protein